MLIGAEPYGSGLLGSEFDEESGNVILVLEFILVAPRELVIYG